MPIAPAFGSPGGKSHLAPRIVKLIPKHTTYVEPYAGGAAVFWRKEPSHREVLNDKDPEIAAAYRFLKNMTAEQFKNENSLQRLINALNKTRGKFILSLGTEHAKLLPKRWHIKRVGVRRKIVDPDTSKPIKSGMEILAANFKI